MNTDISIISAAWVIPIEPSNTVLFEHAVVIENNLIVDVCPTVQAIDNYPGALHIERQDHVLIPGLINAHTHSPMCLLRGLADDKPLDRWLNEDIWPTETKWVDANFVHDGSALAIAEMLSSGTSCFTDMYLFPEVTATLAQELGIRATVGLPVFDFPSAWGEGPDEYFEKGIAAHHEMRSLSRVTSIFSPHAPYTISDEPLIRLRTYADELDISIQMHVHESAQEVNDALAQSGKRPLQRLDELGLLNPKMIAVHMTQLEDSEIELIASHGVHVAHCPTSNAKLANGQCRVNTLLNAGVNVCLGTDGAASNNNLDMFAEMRLAALGAKTESNSAEALPAWQVLEMATINGAKAINQQHEIGSLKVGKLADIVAINLNHISTQPVYDPISQLVYSASREQVTDVWVDGQHLLESKNLSNMDIDHLLYQTKQWANKIRPSTKYSI